ncbi:hypothetical protein Tco_0380939 [Tanacetum coccineum]
MRKWFKKSMMMLLKPHSLVLPFIKKCKRLSLIWNPCLMMRYSLCLDLRKLMMIDDDSENVEKLSVANEVVVDNVIDELVDIEKTQDANLNVSAAKATDSDPLGYLKADITSLTVKERIPELLSDTLKNILPQLLKDSVKKVMPKFDKRITKTTKAEVDDSFLKPMYKEFNDPNKLET